MPAAGEVRNGLHGVVELSVVVIVWVVEVGGERVCSEQDHGGSGGVVVVVLEVLYVFDVGFLLWRREGVVGCCLGCVGCCVRGSAVLVCCAFCVVLWWQRASLLNAVGQGGALVIVGLLASVEGFVGLACLGHLSWLERSGWSLCFWAGRRGFLLLRVCVFILACVQVVDVRDEEGCDCVEKVYGSGGVGAGR